MTNHVNRKSNKWHPNQITKSVLKELKTGMDCESCKIKADPVLLHTGSLCLKLKFEYTSRLLRRSCQEVCCSSHRDKQDLSSLNSINLPLFISHYVAVMVLFSDFFPSSVKFSYKANTQMIQFEAAETITQK